MVSLLGEITLTCVELTCVVWQAATVACYLHAKVVYTKSYVFNPNKLFEHQSHPVLST